MNYYNVYGEKLSDNIKNRYLELLKMLNNEHIILLFRGDKLRNISKKLKIDINDIQKISKKIFKIGEKSKSYLNNNSDINEVNDSVFEEIFDRINKYFVDDGTHEENIEEKFVEYFSE